jgi:hypothetical protein
MQLSQEAVELVALGAATLGVNKRCQRMLLA